MQTLATLNYYYECERYVFVAMIYYASMFDIDYCQGWGH